MHVFVFLINLNLFEQPFNSPTAFEPFQKRPLTIRISFSRTANMFIMVLEYLSILDIDLFLIAVVILLVRLGGALNPNEL